MAKPLTQDQIDAFVEKVEPVRSNITPARNTYIKNFGGTKFVGHILGSMKFSRLGDMTFTVQVPWEYRDAAYLLTDALEQPLMFDIRLWEIEDD